MALRNQRVKATQNQNIMSNKKGNGIPWVCSNPSNNNKQWLGPIRAKANVWSYANNDRASSSHNEIRMRLSSLESSGVRARAELAKTIGIIMNRSGNESNKPLP